MADRAEKAASAEKTDSESFAAVHRRLADLDPDALTANEYAAWARALAAVDDLPHVRIAYLANFTIDLLPRYVEVRAAREGILARGYAGRFGQHVQEVLEEDGPLARFAPDVIFLALSLPLLRPAVTAFGAIPPAARAELRQEVADHVEGWARAASSRFPASLLVSSFPAPVRPAAGAADANDEYGEAEFHLELNLDLLRRFKGNPRVRLFDLDRALSRFGKDRAADRRMFHLAKMEWSAAFLPTLADELVRQVRAVRGLAKKVLVLDLDNTLWGGVVGEEGAAGVKAGEGDPEAEAYLAFQRRLKDLQRRGVLLAVCSKNNPADAREVFDTRPELPLSLDDFAALEISWEPKHDGLKRIAAALNVGLDSLVFLDDNPAEVELVRQMLPEVKAVALPRDPAEYAAALDRLTDFERVAILAEDARKTEQYRENRRRQDLASEAVDLESYLASLETRLAIRPAGPEDLPRVHQLFAKTNQFNATTIRYSQGDVERFAASPDHELGIAAARDRFGDLGTIAVYLLERRGEALVLDSLLMSCRAMGRGIEVALMNCIKSRLANGYAELTARYAPTAKNKPVESYFEDQGFRLVETRDGGEKLYALAREEAAPKPCPWIEVRAEPVDPA